LIIGRRDAGGGRQSVLAEGRACQLQQVFAPIACHGRAAQQKQRAYATPAGQCQRAVQQGRVAGFEQGALEPDAFELEVLPELTGHKRLTGARQAQRRDIPADQLGAGSKLHVQAVFGQAAAVAQRLQGQPFEPCPGLEQQAGALQRRLAHRSVKARRTGGGDQPVGPWAHLDRDVERVTADQSARRMHQHVVTNRLALRVQALQDAQWAFVGKGRDAAAVLQPVVEREFGLPSHGWAVYARQLSAQTRPVAAAAPSCSAPA
jgi:hypothetical protein